MASNYPGALDTLATNKADATVTLTDHPAHHNDLADAVNKIEAELGTLPKGASADVKTRIAAVETSDALKAPLASPTFTGTPAVPTAGNGTNTTQAASTAFVQTAAGLLVPKSLVTAKGDLVVATGSGAVTNKAVGTDGKVLAADSSQSDGLAWASTVGFGPLGDMTTQRWYGPISFGSASNGTKVSVQAQMEAYPFVVNQSTTFDRIGINCSGAGTAGAVVRLGIYNNSGGLPTTLVLDAGTIDATGTGDKTITISQVLAAGIYWLAACTQGNPGTTPTLRVLQSNAFPLLGAAGPVFSANNGVQIAAITGALPSPFGTIAGYLSGAGGSGVLLPMVRKL